MIRFPFCPLPPAHRARAPHAAPRSRPAKILQPCRKDTTNAAYFDYQRERIYLRSSEAIRQAQRHTRRRKQRRLRATKRLSVTGRTCSTCKRKGLPEIGQKVFVKQAFDLRITPAGILRRVTEYQTKRLWCADCRRAFLPHGFRRMDPFRHSLKSWVTYMHVAHQLSLPKLRSLLDELFEIEIATNYVHMIKAMMARHYRRAYNELQKSLIARKIDPGR